jgi:hypothetical protein
MNAWCVCTQVQENYGAHDWDGKGECPQYWKFKGGNEYKVVAASAEEAISAWNAWFSLTPPNANHHQEWVLTAIPWSEWVKSVREDYPEPSETPDPHGDYGGYLIRVAEAHTIGSPST